MAMECGCSGVLGGRAFWKEYFLQDGGRGPHQVRRDRRPQARRRRRRRGPAHGTPWFAKYGLTQEDLTDIRASEGWHFRYAPRQGRRRPGGHRSARAKVY